MQRVAILVVCLLQAALAVHGEGYYTIIGPGTIHSGHKYNVAVGLHNSKESAQFKVGIIGPEYNEQKTVDLLPDEVQNVEFSLPLLPPGDYNLTAEGVAGIIFKNTTKLNHDDTRPNIKIQTDKGKYKPGDVVNFRVLFVDENLKPTQPLKETTIWFEDGKRNHIKEYKHIEATKGVYTGKFQLSEFPVLGSWSLTAGAGPGVPTTSVRFKVEKYVLPKYKVNVESTKRVSVKDGDIQVVVRANYTYGKPVDGKVTLVFDLDTFRYYNEKSDVAKPAPERIIKTADTVNGKAKFDVNVKQYKENIGSYASTLTITATVEENFTGVKINGTTSSTLYANRYAVGCVHFKNCYNFEADKEMDVIIQVTHVDGTHLKDSKSVVQLKYTEAISKHYYHKDGDKPTPEIANRTFVFESLLNATSMAVFKVKLPDLEEYEGFGHYYAVEVDFEDETHKVTSTYQHRPPKKTDETPKAPEEPKDYFTATTIYQQKDQYSGANLGETVIVSLNSSVPLTYFDYTLVGRGNILETKRVTVPDNAKLYNITFKATFLMAPRAMFYAYYVDEEGEFHYVERSISVKLELQNKIEITAPEQVKPGAEVALRIKTEPHSFVGMLAVDQSVLLLSSNNDITPNAFHWPINTYVTYTPWQGGYSPYPGSQTGVVTLTNANYFYNRTSPYHPHENISTVAPMNLDHNRKTGLNKNGAPRPEAAGPAGFISMSAGAMQPGLPVRTDFSETWLFADIEDTLAEEFTWTKKIPDTITSWVVTGFSLHADKGVGVTQAKTNIVTFQPFFISIRLPYSVKRGEVINVPALVFNYLDKDLDVAVTLDNVDGEYEFTEVSNEVINEPKREKTVRVPAQSSRAVSFMIRPKVIGNILLKFTAVSPIAGDAIHKPLKVVPEGVTEYANRAYFVNLKDKPEFKESFELALPAEIVPDSEHIEFTVIGDLLGPLLNNLDHLVRMPTGCGEQTMSSLVPNYFVLKYLKSINKLNPTLENRITHNLLTGYQRLLSYRHDDGSFSSFGSSYDKDKPREGSTWLTAYVVRSLNQMKDFVDVDNVILNEGLTYLAGKQAENGSFIESRDFYYDSQQQLVALTASVLLSFLENENATKLHQDTIDKGFKFILENFEKTANLHAKALATYALHKANHPMARTQLTQLQSLAKTDDDRMWWSESETEHGGPEPRVWWRWVRSRDVEITSYILLTLLDSEPDTVLPIVKWLVAQRNSYGGFSSTQDTVVGLQALTAFVTKEGYEPAIIDINVKAKGGMEKEATIKVNEENGLLLQSEELPHKTLAVDFEAKGKGAALVQIAYQYNVLEKEKKPSFTIETIIKKETPAFKLEMDVCVQYTGEKEASNMALLEISLPSGYVADVESFEHIQAVPRVRQTETKNGDSVIVIYFDSLHKNELQCLPVEALKSFAVARQKPASIVLYDYYDTAQKATDYYEVVSKLCDICEDDEECKKACQ